MESYLISDNQDTLIGMQLAGVAGEFLTDSSAILKRIDELIDQDNIGIIILTQGIKRELEEEVMMRKMMLKDTLIVTIPGPNETIERDFITKYIRDSIGLKL